MREKKDFLYASLWEPSLYTPHRLFGETQSKNWTNPEGKAVSLETSIQVDVTCPERGMRVVAGFHENYHGEFGYSFDKASSSFRIIGADGFRYAVVQLKLSHLKEMLAYAEGTEEDV
jgi:ribosomal protein L21E